MGRDREKHPPAPAGRDPLAWLVLVLVLGPIVLLQVPPLVDLAAHTLRLYLVAYTGPEDPLWDFYSFTLTFTPNFGFDALFYGFAALLPFGAALALAVYTCFGLLAFGIIALSRALHGRVMAGGVFACVFVFSWPMQLGFMNFGVALGLALWTCALYLRRPRAGIWPFVLFALLSVLVWGAHVAGWGTLGLMVLGVELARIWQAKHRWGEIGHAILRMLPFGLPAVMTVVWIALFTQNTGTEPGAGYSLNLAQKLAYVISTFQVEIAERDLALLALALALGLWAFASPRSRLAAPARIGAGLLGLAFLFLPTGIGTTYFLDRRMLMPLGLVLFVGLGAGQGGLGRTVRAGMAVAAAAYIGAMTLSWQGMARESDAQRALLADLPPKSRVLLLEVRACLPSQFDLWPVMRHPMAALEVVQRARGFINGTWDLPDSNGLGVPYARDSGWNDIEDAVIRSDLCPADHWVQRITKVDVTGAVAEIPREAYDFIWLLADRAEDLPGAVAPALPAGFEPVGGTGLSALYRIPL